MVFMYKQLPLSRTENNTLLSPFKWAKGTSTFTTPAKATRATEKASSQHPGKAVPPAKTPRGAGENPRTPHAPRADDLSHSHNLTLYVLPHLMALMVFIMVFMVFIMVFIFFIMVFMVGRLEGWPGQKGWKGYPAPRCGELRLNCISTTGGGTCDIEIQACWPVCSICL